MKWYFCLNEHAADRFSEVAKVAVLTCLQRTRLIPHFIFDGQKSPLTTWMEDRGVTVHYRSVPFLTQIYDRTGVRGLVPEIARGAYLRVIIPEIDDGADEFVLYTDADVMFMRDVCDDLRSIKPRFLAAAPELDKDNYGYLNSGVMLLNSAGMKQTYKAFLSFIEKELPNWHSFSPNDQGAYNYFFREVWDRLPPEFNWKPYWGQNPAAAILHFHGMRPSEVESAITTGFVDRETKRIRFKKNRESYEAYVRHYFSVAASGLDTPWNASVCVAHDRFLILRLDEKNEQRIEPLSFEIEIDGNIERRIWVGAPDQVCATGYEAIVALPTSVLDGRPHIVRVRRSFSHLEVRNSPLYLPADVKKSDHTFITVGDGSSSFLQDKIELTLEPASRKSCLNEYTAALQANGVKLNVEMGKVKVSLCRSGFIFLDMGLYANDSWALLNDDDGSSLNRSLRGSPKITTTGEVTRFNRKLETKVYDGIAAFCWAKSTNIHSWYLEAAARVYAFKSLPTTKQCRLLTTKLSNEQKQFLELLGVASQDLVENSPGVIASCQNFWYVTGSGVFAGSLHPRFNAALSEKFAQSSSKRSFVVLVSKAEKEREIRAGLYNPNILGWVKFVNTSSLSCKDIAIQVASAAVLAITDSEHWKFLSFVDSRAHLLDLCEEESCAEYINAASCLGLGYRRLPISCSERLREFSEWVDILWHTHSALSDEKLAD